MIVLSKLYRHALALLLLIVCGSSMFFSPGPQSPGIKEKLSEYGFFTGNLADLQPASGVLPYVVNAPLFSDYAEKARFIYLPEGAAPMGYDAENAFAFPTGAVIIKHFYYWNDARDHARGRKVAETRLLIKTTDSWQALTYRWNDAQTDADLEVAGAAFPLQWVDAEGHTQQMEYVMPNVNQCKGCHSYDGQFVPLGINARQLNHGDGTENQLLNWQKLGKLTLPAAFDPAQAPRLADYTSPAAPLDQAARAYLDANCGHCHQAHGPASTSGMFLNAAEQHMEKLGVGKPPVAAGRGSGDRRFGIVPGKPAASILVYRMESTDPGIRMPELGRQLPHKEGIALIKSWIKAMK